MYDMLKLTPSIHLDLCYIKMHKDINITSFTEYILKEIKDGILVCVLQDNLGQLTHAIGINLKLRLIYDYMEECAFDLNKHNLSRCCGDGRIFKEFRLITESKPNP